MAEGLRAATGALALLALLPLAAAPARAQADPARALAGKWSLEQQGAPRQCTLTLGPESTAHGRQLRFPATCRRALPVLNGVTAWSPGEGGLPQLLDGGGKPVLAFRRSGAAGRAEAAAGDGLRYALLREGQPARPAGPPAAETAATAAARPTTVDPARAPAPESLPGRYAIMRQQGREACRIALSPAPGAAQAPAAFEGSCSDVGLTIFDPVAWRYAAGRLTLVARRGHSVDLAPEGGLWRKDPAVGAPLLLKKLGP